jgi:hypothetical protein
MVPLAFCSPDADAEGPFPLVDAGPVVFASPGGVVAAEAAEGPTVASRPLPSGVVEHPARTIITPKATTVPNRPAILVHLDGHQ